VSHVMYCESCYVLSLLTCLRLGTLITESINFVDDCILMIQMEMTGFTIHMTIRMSIKLCITLSIIIIMINQKAVTPNPIRTNAERRLVVGLAMIINK